MHILSQNDIYISGIRTKTQNTIKSHQIPALRVGVSAADTPTVKHSKFRPAAIERADEPLDLIQDIQSYLDLHVGKMQQGDIKYEA
jgi:hypothetical protein